MKKLLLPLDDNWGSGSEPVPYPALPRKAAVSKSVQKRRERQAKSFQKLVDSTIVLGRTPVPGRTARLQAKQRRQEEAARQPNEQPEQGSAADAESKKRDKAQKKDKKKLAVPVQATPAAEEQRAEPSSKRRAAPTEQAAGSLSQPLSPEVPLKRKKQTAGQLTAPSTEAELSLKQKKRTIGKLAAPSTEAEQAGSGVQEPQKRRRAQEAADTRTEPVPGDRPESEQMLPGKKQKRASIEQRSAGRATGMLPTSLTAAAPLSSRRERAEAAAQKRAHLAASKDGAAEVRDHMERAEEGGHQPDEPPAKKKRRKSGQRPGADQSVKEPREAGQNRRRREPQGLGKGFSGYSRKEEPDLPEAAASQGAQQAQPAPGLLDKMAARLHGSRFRWLNETLYTSTGDTAFALMQDQPELFDQYHKGFQQQTKNWPQQPVDAAIRWLRKLPGSLRVADFGCGDAALALAVDQKVACLDLVATVPGVIACNMSDTPLESGSMDVAVFCLALMGTDYPAFLREAARVVKPGGRLWIAEVRSRFAAETGEDFQPFLAALRGLGFELVKEDASNKMFVVFQLRKTLGSGDVSESTAPWPELKPCLYKRR